MVLGLRALIQVKEFSEGGSQAGEGSPAADLVARARQGEGKGGLRRINGFAVAPPERAAALTRSRAERAVCPDLPTFPAKVDKSAAPGLGLLPFFAAGMGAGKVIL
jgi:hypothetical protein